LKQLIALSLILISTTANAVTYNYNIQVLDSLGGDSVAYGLNDNGDVVGQSIDTSISKKQSVIWSGGVVTSLGVNGVARDINNSGTVVGETGTANTANPTGYAYSWTSTGGITNLGTLGGAYSGAYDINEAGVITGFAWPSTAEYSTHGQGFIYEDDTMSPLGTVSSPTGYSRGHGINDSNEIVGRGSQVDFSGSNKYTIYWDENQNLNQFVGPGSYSSSEAINNNGMIVGGARTASTGNTLFASIWDTDGNLTFLNNADIYGSKAWGVNDSGVIVGYDQSGTALATKRAFVALDGLNMVDLTTLVDLSGTGIVTLTEAFDVNASGQIVGVGITSTGEQKAFMLTAIPVPAAVWLFASALGLLGWTRRNRNQAFSFFRLLIPGHLQ